jgi:Zn-dependent protease
MPGSIRVARLSGIPIGIHPLWFLVVGLITLSLGADYYPGRIDGIEPGIAYALGFASALLLFASVVLHELGHSLVARRYGIEIQEIDLWLLGGVAVMKEGPHRPEEELRFALAGPAVSVVIASAFALLALALSGTQLHELQAVAEYQAVVNALIVGFNLLPAFPLDGGRVARALLWRRTGDKARATITAATVSRAFAWGFITLALLSLLVGAVGGLWLGIIGLFLLIASRAEASGMRVHQAFEGHRAGELMSHPVVAIPGNLTIEEAVRRYFVPYRYTAFPVVDHAGKALGLLTLDRVKAARPSERASLLVAALADHNQDLQVDEDQDVAQLLERPAFVRAGRAIVTGSRGEPNGIVSITDVQRALRAAALTEASEDSR